MRPLESFLLVALAECAHVGVTEVRVHVGVTEISRRSCFLSGT
jgi:hypothetical protein